METYPGLPGPVICDYWQRDAHNGFNVARMDMVVNTGTYIDAPFHRYPDRDDIAQLPLEQVAALPGLCLRVTADVREISESLLLGLSLQDHAVLLHTGWDKHWRTAAYTEVNPFLSVNAAQNLRAAGVALVGIDSVNIDDRSQRARPVHEILLKAGIPIVEHLTGLEQLPADGFRFFAMPARVRGVGSFPVRACAEIN